MEESEKCPEDQWRGGFPDDGGSGGPSATERGLVGQKLKRTLAIWVWLVTLIRAVS